MPMARSRARWIAPALALASMAGGCDHPSARIAARQARLDPPELWRVEALDAEGRVSGAVRVCADATMRGAFGRVTAESAGRPCRPLDDGVDRSDLYAVRCDLGGRRFGLTLSRQGDPAHAFTQTFALRALDGAATAARQVRRFRRLGPCPDGWRIGEQIRDGAARRTDSLAGVWPAP
ncbi:MAG: hypothetical protein GC203_18385 [Phenylobacterium sp.]|uniref:hypothetical protein n=1 Tax=Phenylobacterium sp. TaxID=1871053 RepID=UPI0025EBFE62|nr:hypothetical protein [Phenylobacterium sp.]MBI1199832.1 hypothetical protein [Phenylobacterium sp.]